MTGERVWLVASRAFGLIVTVLLFVLVATGLALAFRYRPDVTSANVTGVVHSPSLTARGMHRLASIVLLPAVGCLAIASIGLFLVRRDRASIALPLVAGFFALLASFTGFLLPWDQLALHAVTVGVNLRGYGPILGDHSVRYVLRGSRELSTATVARWFWVHSVGIPLALAGALVGLTIRTRRRPAG